MAHAKEILIVDDEVGIRELLSEILQDEGYRVALAENAGEARAYRQRQQPALVLLDIWMPDTDGVTLLREWAAGGQLTRLHYHAVGAPGSRTPLTLEVKGARDLQGQNLPVRLVHGSIEVLKDDDTDRVRGSCCGLDRLVLEDVYCALEMSVELRPVDLIMDMDGVNGVNARDAAIIIQRLSAAARTGQ